MKADFSDSMFTGETAEERKAAKTVFLQQLGHEMWQGTQLGACIRSLLAI